MDGEDLSADALSRLWRARKTLAQMLADREYMVLEEDQALTFDEFKERFGVGSGLRYCRAKSHCKRWSNLCLPRERLFLRAHPPARPCCAQNIHRFHVFPGAIAGSA